MEHYQSRENVGVYDLSGGQSPDVLAHPAISALMEAGFNLANKDNKSNEQVLLSRGTVMNAALQNGMAFVNTDLDNPVVHIFVALPADTPQADLNKLFNNFNVDMFKDPDSGMNVGYISVSAGNDPDFPYMDTLAKLNQLKLKTAPYPFTDQALGYLPLFNNRDWARSGLDGSPQSRAQATMKLADCFNGQMSVIDLPDDMLDLAMSRAQKSKISPDDDVSRRRDAPTPRFR